MDMTDEQQLIHELVAEKYELKVKNNRLTEALNMAVKELCVKCGRGKDRDLGACDRCKWNPIRNGEMP